MTIIVEPENRYWRTDTRMGRNIYALLSNDVAHPSEDDPMIGVMDSSELAEDVVDTHNDLLQMYGRRYRRMLSNADAGPKKDLSELYLELNPGEKLNLHSYIKWLRDGMALTGPVPYSVDKLLRALGGPDV